MQVSRSNINSLKIDIFEFLEFNFEFLYKLELVLDVGPNVLPVYSAIDAPYILLQSFMGLDIAVHSAHVLIMQWPFFVPLQILLRLSELLDLPK